MAKMVTFDGYARIPEEQKIWTGYRNTIIYTTHGNTINVVLTTRPIPRFHAVICRAEREYCVHILSMFFNGGMIPT
jgi:putative aldouronate transport system permease protein